nr:hypothetical protein BaRGS_020892 [Batillaria attramentaria]
MKTRGKPQLPSLSRFIADMTFSILLQTLFLIQGSLCRLVPLDILSHLASVVHMGLLYALYAFEYKWFNMVLIISANEAEEPQEPFDFSLKIFAPVVYLTNGLYRLLSKQKSSSSGPDLQPLLPAPRIPQDETVLVIG